MFFCIAIVLIVTIPVFTGEIHEAAINGNFEKITALIQSSPDSISAKNQNGDSPLHLAAENGHLEIVKFLIEKGADVLDRNNSGRVALHQAAIKGHIDVMEFLIAQGTPVDAPSLQKYTPLHYTAMWGNKETLEYLIAKGANVNNRESNNNYTPIIHATAFNKIENVETLIKHGAEVNVLNDYGASPLHRACTLNHLEMINVLLSHGADLNLKNDENSTPIMESAKFGYEKGVELLLKEGAKTDIQENKWGFTALHYCVVGGNVNAVENLLEAGANINIPDNNGKTPYYYAVKYGHRKIIELLRNNGANNNFELKASDIGELLEKSLETNEAYIWYTRFGGWIVKTRNNLLIFNYTERNNLPDEPSLSNGYLTTEEIKNLNIYVFISHANNFHFTQKVLNFDNSIKNITYIFGFHPEESNEFKDGYTGPKYEFIEPHQSKMINNLKISTVNTNDPGEGFIVESDGIKLYLSAYLANKGGEAFREYKNEIDFVAEKYPKLDLAFIQTTYGYHDRKPAREGFIYAVDKLRPKAAFPMGEYHYYEYNYKDVVEQAENEGIKIQYGIAEHGGDRFHFINGKLEKSKSKVKTPSKQVK